MEKIRRSIFFWTLTVLFFIIAPSLVLYARGYRIDFQKGVFVYSGTITLKTNPEDVQISLNGKLEKATASRINNSLNVAGLIPREYRLTISAPGFNDWNKKTEVHSGVSSEFWNILLTRKEYAKTAYATGSVEKFFISPEDKFIALENFQDGNTTVNILDIENNEITQTYAFPDWQFITEERKENIEWSPKEDYLLIPLEKKTLIKNTETTIFSYFVVDPKKGTSFNLNEYLEKEDIKNARWHPADKDYLFFLSGTDLFRANITDKNDLILVDQDISSFDLAENGVYYSQLPNELVFRKELNGKNGKTQITFASPKETRSLNEKLIVYDEARIAFLDKEKNLFIFNKGLSQEYLQKIGSAVEGIQFSDDGKKLLFWSANEISVHFLRDWNVQPLRVENETKEITRYAEKISNVQWFKDYEHVIFAVGSFTKIIELDNRDYRICNDLLTTETTNPQIVYNHYLEKMFFSDQSEKGSLFFSIDIPEKTSFLGF
jgi:hypothetical protein